MSQIKDSAWSGSRVPTPTSLACFSKMRFMLIVWWGRPCVTPLQPALSEPWLQAAPPSCASRRQRACNSAQPRAPSARIVTMLAS